MPRNRFGHTVIPPVCDVLMLHLCGRVKSTALHLMCQAVIYAHSMYIFGGWDGHDTLQDDFVIIRALIFLL